MPAINKIRFTNVIYEDGAKRYNDETFLFDGHNSAIVLENGGGKTVFIQTALQAVLPHTDLANRKMKHTLRLEGAPAHIAIEWIINERPRRYAVTCVSLFLVNNQLDSYRYVYEYDPQDPHSMAQIPFVIGEGKQMRPAGKGEIQDYYQSMLQRSFHAKTFQTIRDYKQYIEEHFQIVSDEWESIVKINSTEGGVEEFFDHCKQTGQLFDRLLIPAVEQSISGYRETDFADTFEKHRENFKKYKELRRKIEENTRIEEELEQYTETFAILDEKERDYVQARSFAKAAMEIVTAEIEKGLERKDRNEERQAEWERAEKIFRAKRASFLLAKAKQHLDSLEADLRDITARHAQEVERKNETINLFHSLRLAQFKKRLQAEQDKMVVYKQELETIEQEQQMDEIRDEFAEKEAQLKGYFLQELERYEEEIRDYEYECRPLERQEDEGLAALKEIKLEEAKWTQLINENAGALKQLHRNMVAIAKRILSSDSEAVKDEIQKWITEHAELDEEMVNLETSNKQLRKDVEALETRYAELKEDEYEGRQKLQRVVDERERVKEAEKDLVEQLGGLKPVWATMENVYQKESSIGEQLQQMTNRLQNEKELLLKQERVASRYADDYENQSSFFADAVMERYIMQWKNQFSLLQTGVEYIQAHEIAEEEWVKQYPFWSTVLITTEAQRETLIAKVQSYQEDIQFPLIILTTKDLAKIKLGEYEDEWVIPPAHWSRSLKSEEFEKWKEEMADQARTAREKRLRKEAELTIWQSVTQSFRDFFIRYPNERVQELESAKLEYEQQLESHYASLSRIREQILEKSEQVERQEIRVKNIRDTLFGLQDRIKEAQDYLQMAQQYAEIEQKQHEYEQKCAGLQKEAQQKERLIQDVQEQIAEIRQFIQTAKTKMAARKADSLYKKVQQSQAIFTDFSLDILEEAYEQVRLKLHQVSQSRNELVAKIHHTEEKIQETEIYMKEILRDYAGLNEKLEFPLTGAEQIESLRIEIKRLEEGVSTLAIKLESVNTDYLTEKGSYRAKVEDFKRTFHDQERIVFEQPLNEVKLVLADEKEELEVRKQRLIKEQEEIAILLQVLEKAFNDLRYYEDSHKIQAASLPVYILSEDDKQEFTYQRETFIKRVIEQLKVCFRQVERERKVVQIAKEQFYDFCRHHIHDIRMREMAMSGVEHKKTYEEVSQFKRQIQNRIHQSSKIAEESMRTYDQQLEQFITHVHEHLVTIVQELALIPKQTRVRVGEQMKQIYTFSIPEWTEGEGKDRIRTHIDWILEQLKDERYLDDEREEDGSRIRKDIEMWLHSKQLLKIVMNSQVMKVTCKKVTNDHEITRRSYSWEETNDWSGGEKWSKNMTLFLGLLNYAAEKKQHVLPQARTHKAVLLDNPFGKASSDHVLSPVFFIAEQLGFQLIALTAHAGGKYLRDYFPVIYSCRLRATNEQGKQVMEKEKWIHQAYFQDHEPSAIERLGEHEQMVLFE